jgi:hypothetical protein
MLGIGALPALAQMIGFMALPHSPTWLMLQGRRDDAERVLRKIRPLATKKYNEIHSKDDTGSEDETTTENSSNNGSEGIAHDDRHEDDPVLHELNDIQQEIEAAKQGHDVGLWTLWTKYPVVRRAMILGCSLWAVSQLAGINTIMYYGASIVKKTGVSAVSVDAGCRL